jgi:hypothetical protein
MLGFGVEEGKPVCAPVIPERLGRVFLHGVHAFGSHYDVSGQGTTGEVAETT